jgi:hypothetical protein
MRKYKIHSGVPCYIAIYHVKKTQPSMFLLVSYHANCKTLSLSTKFVENKPSKYINETEHRNRVSLKKIPGNPATELRE